MNKLREAINRILQRDGERQPLPRNRNRARFNLRGRLTLVVATLGLCSVSLIGRAAYVQLIGSDFYQKEGDARFVRELEIPTSRGMITDRNGEPVAVSSPVESVWCDPKELIKSADRLPALAQALGMPADELTRKVTQRADKEFMYLKRRINPDAARKIVALNIPGLYSKREFRRFYPQGEAMAHVLGFTNIDDHGQEGLELAFDDWLSGKPGLKKVIRDRRGRIVENIDLVRQAQPGSDLTLSIDRRIQYLTYKELKQRIVETGAASGSAVVMDIATGEVLAMANLPTFNPNAASLGKPDAHRNRAVTDVIEPGSTMKPITVAAALSAGVVTPQTLVDTSPGSMPNGRYRITDTHNNGVLTVTGVITKSSNVGAAKLAAKLPDTYFYDFVKRFHYGEKPGSGFPGESTGVVPSPGAPNWYGTTKATMSYGYGLNATPLQIARTYSALANGGKMFKPTFVKGERSDPEQVLDPKIAHEVLKMMQTVTEPGGTATIASILGYHVGGKTGTARKAGNGGYLARKYVLTFAGVVPIDNPRFAMVVSISEPDIAKSGSYYAGPIAAPVFRKVMEGSLRLMDVPPDDIDSWLAAQARAEAKRAGKPVPVGVAPVIEEEQGEVLH
ncbi:peptidoglycan D,D-transpeptidase FtsI family protein [Pseudoxanthomonas composti]|uniref:Peptidoglycan D,D-transpeptidase FtsI n=1 Tax=Pseudoxanthomonas composti TaxID=2137479 RepID=A0A4Q1JRX7_9GAMM|nr:penicillin-binding protein 2 [Pseudoxanthomonas composti]RXR01420.1 penicillin-binding protein 2 [Pseudoxanthomonas composti]